MTEQKIQIDRQYLKDKVEPYLEELIKFILLEKPEDPLELMVTWAMNKAGIDKQTGITMTKGEIDEFESLKLMKKEQKRLLNTEEAEYGSENEEIGTDEEEMFDDEAFQNMPAFKAPKKVSRCSNSAEAFGLINKMKKYEPKIIPKSDEIKQSLKDKLLESFLFSNLQLSDLNIVIDAMEEVNLNADDLVIKEGDDGDKLYMVITGSLDCYKNKEGTDEQLKTYETGEVFGELALLQNCPRAATIKAKEKSQCFTLDRDCFNAIVKTSAQNRREKYLNFLDGIELLKEMDTYERNKLCDVLITHYYKDGEYIIKQGEVGNTFYFVYEGACRAEKEGQGVVMNYKIGDYFGELSLMKNEDRAASIIAEGDVQLVSIDRAKFKRLLGPLEKILARNTDKYNSIMSRLSVIN